MNDRRHWLCIACSFPPVSRSGTHRTSAFVRHLDRLGWDATVITSMSADEPIDEELLAYVPKSTRIVRVPWIDPLAAFNRLRLRQGHAKAVQALPTRGDATSVHTASALVLGAWLTFPHRVKEWITRLLKTPDSRCTWIPSAVLAALREIRRRRPHVIYSTSPYMSAHLVALIVGRLTRIPWVADFRDPWTDNPYRDLSFRSLQRLDRAMESAVLRNAVRIVCNTTTLQKAFAARGPAIAAKCRTIMNGVDSELFAGLSPSPFQGEGWSEGQSTNHATTKFTLLHCGQFYGRRRPHELLAAVGRAVARNPNLSSHLRVVLLGPPHYDGQHLCDLARREGVERWIDVQETKSHQQTLSDMAAADALLLIGSGGTGRDLQVPNKLLEYLGARRPILAAIPPDSPAVNILRTAKADAFICNPDDVEALTQAISTLADQNRPVAHDAWSGVAAFDRAHRARELADVFNEIVLPRPRMVRQATAARDRVAQTDSFAAPARWSSPDHAPRGPVSYPAGS